MRPRVKRRLVLLLALAALAAAYLVRGVAQTRAPATPPDATSPEGAQADELLRPRAPRPRFGTPPDQPRYVILSRDEFALWYRAHAPGLGLPEVADDSLLAGFATDVIEPLGRIPRPPILRVLLAEYAPHHAKDASATRTFFANLYPRVAYSDLLLLAHSHRWDCEDVPPPPTTERPAGGKPYAGPVLPAIVKFERPLAPWYLAYRFELDLPKRDAEFLADFQWAVVRWLGRVPQPDLLRDLVTAYTPLHQKWKQRTMADRDQAVRVFFDALRRRLSKADYARLAGSGMWKDDCERLGIPVARNLTQNNEGRSSSHDVR